jgi:hypothetical protein
MKRTILVTIIIACIGTVKGAVLSIRQKPNNPNNSTSFQFGSKDTPMRGVNAGGWYVECQSHELTNRLVLEVGSLIRTS